MATETAEKTKEEVLAELEKEFADRYTLKDKEFERLMTSSLPPPPIVQPWHSRPPRNDRGGRDNRWQNRGNNHHDDHHRGRHDDRGRRDDRGYGDRYHDDRSRSRDDYDRRRDRRQY